MGILDGFCLLGVLKIAPWPSIFSQLLSAEDQFAPYSSSAGQQKALARN